MLGQHQRGPREWLHEPVGTELPEHLRDAPKRSPYPQVTAYYGPSTRTIFGLAAGYWIVGGLLVLWALKKGL